MGRPPASDLDGILLVDKPAGWTSHDVVARVRRLTGQRRAGHTGTLDPAATGLLVICLGKATRLVEYMTAHRKRYLGRVQLGRVTTTDDAEGETVAERPVADGWQSRLEGVCREFVGDIEQQPPAVSALKVDGRRAYERARAGEAIELPPRPVTIERLSVTVDSDTTFHVDVTCGAGTYIRSLARDIGEALGPGAHLAALRRLEVGHFGIADSWTLDELAALASAGLLLEAVLPVDEGIVDLPAALLREEQARMLALGQPVSAARGASTGAEAARIYDGYGKFVGVVNVGEGGQIRALKVIFGA